MQVTQVYQLLNTVTQEILGESPIVAEDLSNVVDIGEALVNQNAVDNYVRSLSDHIGKMIFVDRVYRGSAPSVLMDGWEFGSILQKVSASLPEAEENESWELVDGASYDPNIFTKPIVAQKFFNKRVTFEVPLSITRKQVLSAFSNATQLNAFYSMLYNAVDRSMTIKIDGLVMRTINNMAGETVYADYQGENLKTKSGVRAINLLYEYKQANSAESDMTAEEAVKNPDFLRFAVNRMTVQIDRLKVMSSLFNVGGQDRFTPEDMLHVVLLSDFVRGADTYLQSDTFHDQYTALPNADTVPYWQGSGDTYDFSSISSVNIKTASGNDVTISGVLGVMFDRDALGVSNIDRRVTSNYNPKGEFYNYWYKFDAGYFNDLNENFVVFFVA